MQPLLALGSKPLLGPFLPKSTRNLPIRASASQITHHFFGNAPVSISIDKARVQSNGHREVLNRSCIVLHGTSCDATI